MTSPGMRSNGNAHVHGGNSLAQEVQYLKADCTLIRNAVVLLEQEKDNLRQAVRKLKLENGRVKEKVKRLQTEVKRLGGKPEGDGESDVDVDYDEIGRDFLLIGGAMDPLSLRYEVKIRDVEGVEHRSAERFYWYKMAEHFNDEEAKKKILEAGSTQKAEESMQGIKGFREKEWDNVKMAHWEKGQELKLEQVRWITNVLLETGNLYIAVAHQDKVFGTGWRKNREESNKPIFWDGQNLGGKFLMRYRKKLSITHQWAGPNEQEEAHRKFLEMKKYMWRRIDKSGPLQNNNYQNRSFSSGYGSHQPGYGNGYNGKPKRQSGGSSAGGN